MSQAAGLALGTLIYVGEKRMGKAKVIFVDYNEEQFQEKVAETAEESFRFRDTATVTWVNIAGIYGMNFNVEISPWNMPELGWKYGPRASWGLCFRSRS